MTEALLRENGLTTMEAHMPNAFLLHKHESSPATPMHHGKDHDKENEHTGKSFLDYTPPDGNHTQNSDSDLSADNTQVSSVDPMFGSDPHKLNMAARIREAKAWDSKYDNSPATASFDDSALSVKKQSKYKTRTIMPSNKVSRPQRLFEIVGHQLPASEQHRNSGDLFITGNAVHMQTPITGADTNSPPLRIHTPEYAQDSDGAVGAEIDSDGEAEIHPNRLFGGGGGGNVEVFGSSVNVEVFGGSVNYDESPTRHLMRQSPSGPPRSTRRVLRDPDTDFPLRTTPLDMEYLLSMEIDDAPQTPQERSITFDHAPTTPNKRDSLEGNSFDGTWSPAPLPLRSPAKPSYKDGLKERKDFTELLHKNDNEFGEFKRCFSALLYDQHYQELELLGKGNFGEVWSAQHHRTKRMFALKKTTRAYQGSRDMKTHLQEIANVARLERHKNVVKYYRAWQDNGFFFVVMELCTGGTLTHLLQEQSQCGVVLDTEHIRHLAAGLLSGLEHIHAKDLLHLDLKPDNLFLTDNRRRIKIGDFGLLLTENQWEDQEGDREYLAPELLNNNATSSADVFSAGLIIFQMLVGILKLPGCGEDWHSIRNNNFTIQCNPNAHDIAAQVRRMLAPHPSERPSAKELVGEQCFLVNNTPSPDPHSDCEEGDQDSFFEQTMDID